jgi:hypothetical protein
LRGVRNDGYQSKLVAVAILSVIVGLSFLVAPVFRKKLNEQFLLGARNQAFMTEYVSGIETVKSLQMEPQLTAKFGDYLASYLKAGFETKQLANTYNVFPNALEQSLLEHDPVGESVWAHSSARRARASTRERGFPNAWRCAARQ